MTQVNYANPNTCDNCTAMYGESFCMNMSYDAYTALGAVCAFLLALMAIIINGAIISVIICVAIIINVIIICRNKLTARRVYQS